MMEYRAFGRLDWRPSALGFGCMRFPRLPDGSGAIDKAAATAMLHYAIDHGVNYLDTAYLYDGSEQAVGEALSAGSYREKVRLASKLPDWLVKTLDDADRILGAQLERLQTGRIDFYLLHALHGQRWEHIKDVGLLGWAERKMAQGLIGHLGFSFHSRLSEFREIVDGYDGWTFCLVQCNYLDRANQAGTEGLEYAHARGLGVVIMEPLRGGMLAGAPCAEVEALLESAPALARSPGLGGGGAATRRTPAEWSLQWLWSRPEVSVVLSGMNRMDQVVENVTSAERSGVGSLGAEELAFVDRLAEAFRRRIMVPCTYCGYCRACPEGLDLPQLFDIYNKVSMSLPDRTWFERVAKMYAGWEPELHAERCTECGKCEEVCSQRLPVRNWLKRMVADFGVPASAGSLERPAP